MEKFQEFCKTHKWTIICVGVGLIFGILFMTIGFWRTLLLIVLLSICFLIGYLLDKGGVLGVQRFFKKIFSKDNNEQ